MALTHPIFAIFILLLSLMVIVSAGDGYGPSPAPEKSEQEEKEKSTTTIGIQGIIYCQSGSKLTPLEGAVARITCLSIDERGNEVAPFSILSDASDSQGYYFTTLSPSEVKNKWRVKECKAFLELSPSDTCNVPTNVNNGTSGYLLSDYRLLKKRNMILFSVKPFCFSSEDTTSSNGY